MTKIDWIQIQYKGTPLHTMTFINRFDLQPFHAKKKMKKLARNIFKWFGEILYCYILTYWFSLRLYSKFTNVWMVQLTILWCHIYHTNFQVTIWHIFKSELYSYTCKIHAIYSCISVIRATKVAKWFRAPTQCRRSQVRS